jgi:hypothetical protein
MKKHNFRSTFFGACIIFFIVFSLLHFGLPLLSSATYNSKGLKSVASVADNIPKEKVFKATHIETPDEVKGIYMTSWVAGTPSLRANIVRLIQETELNTVVIDIKDDTGRVSFKVNDPELIKVGSEEERIQDLREFIESLHEDNIYVIGRVASFQDPYMVKRNPEFAVKRATDGAVWRDRKGLSWIDPGSHDHWQYLVLIAKESYNAGFDEIQFDYIRFPSDGDMKNIAYPFSETKIKSDVIKEFFAYLHDNLHGTGMKISADLFGMTTTNSDDLGIGQVMEKAFPYFDYISPMVYPSHYPSGFNGYKNVNTVPYEIVKISMDSAVARLKTFNNTVASTTVELRPWLQDNDYPVHYSAEMVRAQMKATYDSGLDSWLLWDAGNTYTRGALLTNQ